MSLTRRRPGLTLPETCREEPEQAHTSPSHASHLSGVCKCVYVCVCVCVIMCMQRDMLTREPLLFNIQRLRLSGFQASRAEQRLSQCASAGILL